MKLKTLLLGTAAAFAFVGGAQAADLSVAEPVDYVKVCDAFGAGYWYIPGTDTCLKIGGYVRFDVNFHDDANVYYGGTHSAGWDFVTKASVAFTAKSMTEYGPLTAFAVLQGYSDNNSQAWGVTGERNVYLDEAYLELGMLLAGRTGSIYDYSGGYTWDWNNYDSDDGADQVRLTWAMSGFGIQLAIEDPRDRWGTSLDTTYSMPNIVGAISMDQGHWSGELSGGFAETVAGSGFGVQVGTTFKLDAIAPGDAFLLKAAWAQNQVSRYAVSGLAVGTSGSVWSAAASLKHFWAPTLSSAVNFQYYSQSAGGVVAASNAYLIAGNLVWAPVTGFFAGVEGGYRKVNTATTGTWGVKIRMQRDW